MKLGIKEFAKKEPIKAIQFDGTREMAEVICDNCNISSYAKPSNSDNYALWAWSLINVSLEVEVSIGDYLIRKDDNFWWLSKAQFESQYQPIETNPQHGRKNSHN
ncbi:MAG: hypothetical protein AAGM67_08340 [Bacteroidota bacterium]